MRFHKRERVKKYWLPTANWKPSAGIEQHLAHGTDNPQLFTFGLVANAPNSGTYTSGVTPAQEIVIDRIVGNVYIAGWGLHEDPISGDGGFVMPSNPVNGFPNQWVPFVTRVSIGVGVIPTDKTGNIDTSYHVNDLEEMHRWFHRENFEFNAASMFSFYSSDFEYLSGGTLTGLQMSKPAVGLVDAKPKCVLRGDSILVLQVAFTHNGMPDHEADRFWCRVAHDLRVLAHQKVRQ